MGTHPDYAAYAAEQLSQAGNIRLRKMFGEYGVYCDGIFFGVICEDQLFVKITPEAEAAFPGLPKAPPHEGARNYFLIEDIDNRESLAALVRLTCSVLRETPPQKKEKNIKGFPFFNQALFSSAIRFINCSRKSRESFQSEKAASSSK